MSRCFTWFPTWCIRRTQYIPELGLFYNVWGILLGVLSDLWRISGSYLETVWLWRIIGGYSQEMMGEGDYWE